MNYAAPPESLWSSPSFVRFTAYSGVAHAAMLLLIVYGSLFSLRAEIPDAQIMVRVMDTLPAPETPEPPAPEPEPEPEPAPVTPPAPEPEPAPEPPKQQVDEALVVPPVPSEKPKPPDVKPKPKPPDVKPKPKPQDVADVMKSLRTAVEATRPKPSGGGPVTVDPELAEYYRRVKACLDTNWVGAQRFQRRRDLEVEFDVELTSAGQVKSVEVTRSSGENQLDDTAERAILKCSPQLPQPPSGRTRIPIVFNPGEVE